MTPDPRCAIVTGGARGIGRAIATRLSRDGFAVAVVDIDEQGALEVAAEIRDSGGTALAVTSDVRDEASTQAGVDRVRAGQARACEAEEHAERARQTRQEKAGADIGE